VTPLDGPAVPFSKSAQLSRPETATPRKLRTRAGKAAWRLLRREKLSRCRVCRQGPPQFAGLDEDQIRVFVGELSDDEIDAVFAGISLHHVVQRGGPFGGADVADNLIPLCGHGTAGCHGLAEAHDPKTCEAIVASLSERERAYALRVGGPGFLERRYHVGQARS
jgi:hypothetical protein